jgi:hypothetical protein
MEKTIKFNFELSLEEADSIFDLLNSEIARATELKYRTEYRHWATGRIEYIKNLKDKIGNGIIR